MNRPQRNNNPTNLKFARQREARGQDAQGFAVFPTPEAGWRAAMRQILLDAERGLTLREYIYKFAPPNENDTEGYLEYVSDAAAINPRVNLSDLCLVEDLCGLADIIKAQAYMEGWYAE